MSYALTSGSPLSSIALSLLVKHGHRFLHEQMVCRQLVQAVKNALDRSKMGTAAIKDKLGLMGAYTDFGLALEIARWFVSEIEAANGTGEVGMRAGETQRQQEQYHLILTDKILNISFVFFLEPVPQKLAPLVFERHFFAPLLGTFAATVGLERARPLGRKRNALTDRDLQVAVDLSAGTARDGGADSAGSVLGERRWSQAMARWSAVASGAVRKYDLPEISQSTRASSFDAAHSTIELASSSHQSDQIDDRTPLSPPPPAQPLQARRIQPSRNKPRTSVASRIFDHNRRDLPGERIAFDETQALHLSSSLDKRAGGGTGLSSQLERTKLTASRRKGKATAAVIFLDSDDDEGAIEENDEPDTEPEPTPSSEMDEPDTDEEDGALPSSSVVALPDPSDTQSQMARPQYPVRSQAQPGATTTQREQLLGGDGAASPPRAVGGHPQVSPQKRKASEAEPRTKTEASIEASKPPPDKRMQLMEQKRRAQLRNKGG